jgi:heat shock protein HslJ
VKREDLLVKELSWFRMGIAALAIGCASAPPAPATSEKTVPGPQYLIGSEWELRDLGGTPVLDDRRPTLSFVEPGRISGNASCNRYGGGADLGDGTIKVLPLAVTKMACTPEVDSQEQAYLAALQNASRLELVGGELVVHTDSLEKPLRFRRTR